jgi:O-antigen ligase
MPVVVTRCVIVLLLALPLKFAMLPLNMSVADGWAACALPLCWVVLLRQGRGMRLPYLPAFLLILGATFLASLYSADPAAGLVVAVQDAYLYVWMITLAAVFENVDARDQRALLSAWCAGAGLSALLIVAQFAHPPLLTLVRDLVGGGGAEETLYRPSGLMANSNAAANFHVWSLLPLILLRPRTEVFAALILLNTAAVLCTGSLGAAVALASGVAAGVTVLLLFSPDVRTVASLTLRSILAATVVLLALVLLMSGGSELSERLQSVSVARGERSADGRFELWQRGADALLSDLPVVGMGPDRFRQVEGSELHNDILGFAVERGLLGLLGLGLLFGSAVVRSVTLFRLERARGRLRAAVFPAALAAVLAASLTHEIFHSREVWLMLAVQEAALWRARRAHAA